MKSKSKVVMVAKICEYAGINKLFYYLNRNRKKIIAYHNVIDDKYCDDTLQLEFSTKESSFRNQIDLISKKFKVDLDFLNDKSVQITFDDGYINQVEKATKILDEYGIKGIVFCVANLIDSKEPLGMDKIMYWFSYAPRGVYEIKDKDIKFEITDNESSRTNAVRYVEGFINQQFSLGDLSKELNKIYKYDQLKYEGYEERFKGATRNDIENMKNRGHLLGAHSSNHEKLVNLSEENLKKDIDKCGEFLEQGIYNTNMFCYPYGGINDVPESMPELLKKNKFTHAVAYDNTARYQYNEYYIPRIFLPDIEDKAVINFILSGLRHFLLYRKLLPKWK
ncbi:MAG: polysaccharide deacetylase family protein [Sarcina sp.]